MNEKKYYKGLDENFQCRGYQFEVGKTYTHVGKVEACSSGFHSCANPWDVLAHYDVTSRFAVVSIGGETVAHTDGTKVASAGITFEAELKLPAFIGACVDFLKSTCASEGTSPSPASGDVSRLAASGNYSRLAASGDRSQLAASGDRSRLAASGDCSQLAASGDGSQLAASGDDSQLAASGDRSQLAASGDGSRLAASGSYSQLAASGDGSVAVCAGVGGEVKGGANCALALTRWVASEERYRITIAYVGEKGIKPDTWYTLDSDGVFTERLEGAVT